MNKLFLLYILSFSIFFYKDLNAEVEEKPIVIVIPSYNNSAYCKQNLNSAFNQKYKNYRIIYVDDCSTDNTGNLVEQYIKENKKEHIVTLKKNSKRELALANIYKSVISCRDDEIIVMLDGDDQLAHENVLNIINETYSNQNIWITHGNYRYLSNNQPCEWDPTFPQHVVDQNLFRAFPHGLTHLRTFYAWLFKQIKIEDLFHEGSFYTMCSDVAIYVPMIEMAGERYKFFKDTFLYIYNDLSLINDHKVSQKLQRYLNTQIRQKQIYNRLDEAKYNFLDKLNYKSDLIAFPADLQNLNSTCLLIKNKIKNLNKVFIVYEGHDQTDLYEKVKNNFNEFIFIKKDEIRQDILKNIFIDIFENHSQYLFFLDCKETFDEEVDCYSIIKNLELTKAFTFLLAKNENTVQYLQRQNVEIIKDVYAFSFEKINLSKLFNLAVYRKKDLRLNNLDSIEKLEMEWKFVAQNKICLFKVVK